MSDEFDTRNPPRAGMLVQRGNRLATIRMVYANPQEFRKSWTVYLDNGEKLTVMARDIYVRQGPGR